MASVNIEPLSPSKIIPHITEYRDVFDFLSAHVAKRKSDPNATITNTRIGDSNLGIPGGSYNITDAEYPTFLDLYYRDVLSKNKKEFLD